jgi:hypothetical protein
MNYSQYSDLNFNPRSPKYDVVEEEEEEEEEEEG